MFELMLFSGAMVAARPLQESDCRPQMILTANGPATRDAVPQQPRPRPKAQQRTRSGRPCIILANS
jgi:hypothetical protein